MSYVTTGTLRPRGAVRIRASDLTMLKYVTVTTTMAFDAYSFPSVAFLEEPILIPLGTSIE